MSDDHSLDTNVVNSDSTAVIIAQDIAAGYFAGEIIEGAIEGASNKVIKVGQRELANQAKKKAAEALLGKFATNRLKKLAEQKMTQKAAKGIKASAGMALRSAAKGAGKIGTGMAAKYSAVMGASVSAGPVSLTVGAVATAAMLAFDIANVVLDIMDTKNYSVLMDRKTINQYADSYKATLQAIYDQAGIPDALTEEVLFYPEQFIFQYDNDGNISMDPTYGEKYNSYIDHYMKEQGFADNWREEMEKQAEELEKNNSYAPGLSNMSDQQKMAVGIVILIIIIILLLMVSKKNGAKAPNQ
jgi:hypothetical protein